MTEIKIIISADDSALEFSRNLAGLFQNLTSKVTETAVGAALTQEVKETKPEPVKVEAPASNASITLEEVRAIASEYLQDPAKRQKLTQTIFQFGIKKVPDLKPEQFGPFVEALRG